jgi:hypothetical protein
MTLRGKDYCNCEHAHMLRAAVEHALGQIPLGAAPVTRSILEHVLAADAAACRDLWGDVTDDRCQWTGRETSCEVCFNIPSEKV